MIFKKKQNKTFPDLPPILLSRCSPPSEKTKSEFSFSGSLLPFTFHCDHLWWYSQLFTIKFTWWALPVPLTVYYSPWKILSSCNNSAFLLLWMKISKSHNKVNIEHNIWWRPKSSRSNFKSQLYNLKTLGTLFNISIPNFSHLQNEL